MVHDCWLLNALQELKAFWQACASFVCSLSPSAELHHACLSAASRPADACTHHAPAACGLQAKWTFSMIAPAGQNVLFNTMQTGQATLPSGLVQHTFAPTPAMSTYLIAFIVGSLVNVSQTVPCMNGNVVVSVWGTPQRHAPLPAADAPPSCSCSQQLCIAPCSWQVHPCKA